MNKKKELCTYSVSLGCPKNRCDTEEVLGSLGVTIKESALSDSELIFINTCGFIESAVRESIATILDVVEECKGCAKKPLLVVAGCLVGRYGRGELAKEICEVDLWLETRELKRWPEEICARLGLPAPKRQMRLEIPGRSYAWLKIGEGCRHRCSFCTIPSIRGPLQSRTKEELVCEANTLLSQGVRELVLVAQDVTSWGQDRGETLKDLLSALLPLSGLTWLRLLYLYPAGLTEDLLHFMAEASPKLLPYFDIPLQHSEPTILTRMGRPFAQNPRTILERVRNIVPQAVFRTSLIVGFPGEREQDFAHLLRFVEEERFHHLGVFAYEREEGTVAFSMQDQVPRKIRQERRNEVLALQQKISRSFLAQFVGEKLSVLVDGPHEEWPGLYSGRVWFQAPEVDGQTYVSGEHVCTGASVECEIVGASDYDLNGLECL